MRRLCDAVLCALLFFVSACGTSSLIPTSACGATEGVVVRVLDGDTIELEDGTKLRYLHVDAPELSNRRRQRDECFAQEAKHLNEELVLNQMVRLEYDVNCMDGFGRNLAFVTVRGRMVNRILLERGYAELMLIKPNLHRESEFVALQEQARINKAGLWGICQ